MKEKASTYLAQVYPYNTSQDIFLSPGERRLAILVILAVPSWVWPCRHWCFYRCFDPIHCHLLKFRLDNTLYYLMTMVFSSCIF
jgi:hypothetical protein